MAFNLEAFLIQMLAVVGGAAVFRALSRSARLPSVVGELVYGILLGPSFLAWAWPSAHTFFFPAVNRPLLEAMGWIGLILFMYIAGSEMRWNAHHARPIVMVAFGGLIVPFVLGTVLAVSAPAWFFPGPASIPSITVVGIVLTVSALPVLARILADTGLLQHPVGIISMGAATIDDVVGWTVLGMVAGGHAVGLWGSVALNYLFIVALFLAALAVDRWISPWFARMTDKATPYAFAWLLCAIFGAAYLTHVAGLNAVLGPFAVGAITSRHKRIREYARTRLGEITIILFLPSFFVVAGSDVDLTQLTQANGMTAVLVVTVVATLAKIVGASLGGRAGGLSAPVRNQAGILLNARGAVGLVAAKVGFDGGLLSVKGFSLLVVAILLTTFAAPVALQIYRRQVLRSGPATADPEPAMRPGS